MQFDVSEHTVTQSNAGWKQRTSLAQEDWDSHLPFFKQLYLDEQQTLEDVMKVMDEKLGFTATKKMYKTNFKRLRVRKNRTKTVEEGAGSAIPTTNEIALTESTSNWDTAPERISNMARVPGAGQLTIKGPARSLSSSGINACAKILLWHVTVLSQPWRTSRSKTSSLLIRTSETRIMILGDSPVSFTLFDMRQGLEVLNEACAVTSQIMSQGPDHLLPILLVEFCSRWWSYFPGLRLSLLRHLTKLGAVKLGIQHPLTVILFHLTDEKVAFGSIIAAVQILTQAAEQGLPLLNRAAASLRLAECCMNIDAMQYHTALGPAEAVHKTASSLYGCTGAMTRSAILRKGEINAGLRANEAARLNYEEALQLSEGQHCGIALDPVGIEAAARLAELYLANGDTVAAQQLCNRALANPWTPFSNPGYRGMGLTLKVMLEETLAVANTFLRVQRQQDDSHNIPGDHCVPLPTQGTVAALSQRDSKTTKAFRKSSTVSDFGAVKQVEVKTSMARTAKAKDSLVMIDNHVVRQATSKRKERTAEDKNALVMIHNRVVRQTTSDRKKRTAKDKDSLVMIHDQVVRQATSKRIDNALTGKNCGRGWLPPVERPCKPPKG